ncbi:MAG: cupin domain-containing protein [Candidatus Scalindua sp.]
MRKIDKTSIMTTLSYTTVDGSAIRELMHPDQHGNKNQSLAEATIKAGCSTRLHMHHVTEELYHITQGKGEMTLGENEFCVNVGDTVCIQPGVSHKIRNTGKSELKILCCCSPHYAHTDIELIDS